MFQDAIGPAFEDANPGVTVSFNVGASDALAGQIQSEGTADVFASASGTWMDEVEKDPGVSDRTDFVMNRLVIITPPDNPADIQSIDDLANPGVQLVLAAEGVPVGDYAREALDNAGILDEALANVVSNEEDNASVVAKITTGGGEADAAIVYTSDVSDAAGNDVNAVTIPKDVNVIATYPIAVVEGAPNADVAADFVAYVVGAEGQATLEGVRLRTDSLTGMHRRLPLGITILALVGAAFVVLPVLALVIRAPWGDLSTSLSGVGATTALRLSIEVSLAATALSLLFGVPLAWLLARGTFPGRSVLRAMVVLPIVLPPVVGGIGLLNALGRSGVAGQWLYEGLGIQLTFTIWGAIIAATFVSMPLVVLATEAGLHSLDQRYEHGRDHARGVTGPGDAPRGAPHALPSVVAGAVLCWARALGEFGATITFAGNLEGRTQTLPLAVYQARQTDPGGAIFLSLILVVISIVVLVAMRDHLMKAR